jgi:hypothetical protein
VNERGRETKESLPILPRSSEPLYRRLERHGMIKIINFTRQQADSVPCMDAVKRAFEEIVPSFQFYKADRSNRLVRQKHISTTDFDLQNLIEYISIYL